MSESAVDVGQHRLITIVFTDVVGFAALAEQDEERALRLLHRDLEKITAHCTACGGQALKNTGDGLLLAFHSAESAVTCAMKVQQELAEHERSLPPDEVLRHRIAVHLGDAYITSSDVLGNDVNITARLLKEAEPNGICISQTVYDVVKNKIGLRSLFVGPRELKNIRNAVPAYKLLLAGAGDKTAIGAIAPSIPAATAPASASRAAKTWWIILIASTTAAAAAILVLIFWRNFTSGTTPVVATTPSPPPSIEPAVTVVAAAGKLLDLAPLIDPATQSLNGDWTITDGVLAIAGERKNNKLQLPITPQGDYDLTVRFRRVEGDHDVVIYLPCRRRQTTLQFGYMGEYDMLGREFCQTHIQNGIEYEATIEVRGVASDNGPSFQAILNGETILKYHEPNEDKIAPFAGSWATPHPRRFGFGADDGKTEFLSARLLMKTGQAIRVSD